MTCDISKSEIISARNEGKLHLLYGDITKGNTNQKVPYVSESEKNIEKDLWLISDPEDCERLARKHIKKMPNLQPKVFDSIISTTDVDHWKDQRSDYVEAFIPNIVLKDLIPDIEKRVRYSLYYLFENVDNTVDMSEFFLNETQAQLQLNMFGFDEDFEKESNKKVRESFKTENKKYLMYWANYAKENGNGPLGEIFQEREPLSNTEQIGNAIIFSFAGHDTTGHTLAWLVYELSKNKMCLKKIQDEVDLFWKNNNHINMENLKQLKYMTLCISETLRMWPANSNGTFREIISEEYINYNGTKLKLEPGSYVQILNWARHRSEDLWGIDVNIFNPEREFKDEEIWNNEGYSFVNPYSERYSPFTYPPRDCIGKNFSHLEMRIMLLYILQNFYFETEYENMEGLNEATMGPRDPNDNKNIGMPLKIKLRNNLSKL